MSLRHRRWVRLANGPVPDPLPRVEKGCCPGYEKRQLSCCKYPEAIYLNRWDWKHRPTFYHELVHWFDRQYLTPDDREEIRQHFGWPRVSWWWVTDPQKNDGSYRPNCERLAGAGVWMYLHPKEHKWLRRRLRAAKERVG